MDPCFEELKSARGRLFSSLSEGKADKEFQRTYTEIIDNYFRRKVADSKTGRQLFSEKSTFALVAVGGYGRKELCVYSDIDVIILFGKKIPSAAKQLVQEILYPLWDLGLDLGYGVRTIDDCVNIVRDDFEVLTSLLGACFICGESTLYLGLMNLLRSKVIAKKAVGFRRWLEQQDTIRMAKFGDASYLLEPNLKDGIGGLRDYHHMLWLGSIFYQLQAPEDIKYQGIVSDQEFHDLMKDLRFIWLVRNHLHLASKRKNDRLSFEYQKEIAYRLGYKDQRDFLAVEQFLGKLHVCMAAIKFLYKSFKRANLPRKTNSKKLFPVRLQISEGLFQSGGELYFETAESIIATPLLLMEIFEKSAHLKVPLSLEAIRLVREFIFLVDNSFRESKAASDFFLDILMSANGCETIAEMYEPGFLEAYIPELARLRDRVQFDAYHIFPVGRHSLQTLECLKSIAEHNDILLLDVFSELLNPRSLFLAGLFHDIGKTSKDHARKGAVIVQRILKRLQYDKQASDDVIFLVHYHLFLVETATRRDIGDEKLVVQCARTIGSLERLKMLYLLTWADSKATGPRAWDDWTANLVRELFFKIRHIFLHGDLATAAAKRKAKQTMNKVKNILANTTTAEELESYFDAMSPRYVLQTDPVTITRHVGLAKELYQALKKDDPAAFVMEFVNRESEGCWGITFLAKDRPGLFADMAGVLSLNDINILAAHIYTWRNGTAIELFKVTGPPDTVRAQETWEKIRKDLRNAYTGRISLANCLQEKAMPTVLSGRRIHNRPPKVLIDNQTSDFFTIIEVFADDRVGLLHLITRAVFALRLDIRIARVATKADQIADVFYVRDFWGQKIEDQQQLEEIKKTLLNVLK